MTIRQVRGVQADDPPLPAAPRDGHARRPHAADRRALDAADRGARAARHGRLPDAPGASLPRNARRAFPEALVARSRKRSLFVVLVVRIVSVLRCIFRRRSSFSSLFRTVSISRFAFALSESYCFRSSFSIFTTTSNAQSGGVAPSLGNRRNEKRERAVRQHLTRARRRAGALSRICARATSTGAGSASHRRCSRTAASTPSASR